ncbi:transposase [Salmonella enterica]|nr:transposase [Salmonella enterica]
MQNDRQSSETVILGVDTHLDVHVGAVISQAGKLLGTHIIQTNQAGYLELLDWARSFGERAGIEGTGTYGAALTRYLIKNSIYVVEVNRPDRSKRRLEGKSDPLDAENAARTVLSGSSKAIPKMQSGACEALRIISVARRSAVKARTQAINQLRALLVSAPQDVRDKLWKSKPRECVAACINSEVSEYSPLRIALCSTLRSLAKRWMALTEEILRCLKRYIVRELYPLILSDLAYANRPLLT